jgi:hypothetical protein
MLTPFAFFFELPSNPWFWILGIIQGLLIAYVDKKTFLCSRIYGGEITASIKPFVIAFVFTFWWLIKPSQLLEMLQTPTTFTTNQTLIKSSATTLLLNTQSLYPS